MQNSSKLHNIYIYYIVHYICSKQCFKAGGNPICLRLAFSHSYIHTYLRMCKYLVFTTYVYSVCKFQLFLAFLYIQILEIM